MVPYRQLFASGARILDARGQYATASLEHSVYTHCRAGYDDSRGSLRWRSTLSTANVPPGTAAIAADAQGNIYLTGTTTGALSATQGSAQPQYPGVLCAQPTFFGPQPSIPCTAAFALKIQAGTHTVLWATYLGGYTNDGGTGIAVDAAGNVDVVGYTSGKFPTTGGTYLTGSGAGMFAVKLSPNGSKFVYSTLIPGATPYPATRNNAAFTPKPSVAADTQGNAYIAGPGAVQDFLIKLNEKGSAPLYNVTLTGFAVGALTVDAAGNAYVAGTTQSALSTTAGAAQTSPGGQGDAFVEKLDGAGNVARATYLGGSQIDGASSIQLDAAGNVYISGTTFSFDFPTTAGSYLPQALLPPWAIEPGGFAAKLSLEFGLLYSTYLIDTGFSVGSAIRVMPDGMGGLYAAGVSGPGFPVTASAPQPCFYGQYPTVVTHLGAEGNLLDRTYFGQSFLVAPIGFANATADSMELAASVEANSGNTAVLADLDFGDGVTLPAACLSPEILNAASFTAGIDPNSGAQALAPGEAITLTGFGMGPPAGIGAQVTADGMLPTELGGVQVLINGKAAPLLYVQSQQINAFAPFMLTPLSLATVSVTYNGATVWVQ